MGGFCWIASYPKSGNTWMRLMLQRLVAGEATDLQSQRHFAPLAGTASDIARYLDIPASDLTEDELIELRPDLARTMAQATPETLFRKVHDCWGRTPSGQLLFPPEVTLASLYLVRDPRDVAVSLAHHIDRTIDEAIASMAEPVRLAPKRESGIVMIQSLSSWSEHVRSWRDADPAPLLIRYEDLRADPALWLTRAAAHCRIAAPPGAIAAAVAATGFARLQAEEDAKGFQIGQAPNRRFFRRGEAGGWRDTLTESQCGRIVADHEAVMRALDYL